MNCAAAEALANSSSARRAGSTCDATANAMIGIPSGPDRRLRWVARGYPTIVTSLIYQMARTYSRGFSDRY